MSNASDIRVYETLAESGIPGTRGHWTIDSRPTGPRFTYGTTGGGETYGDNAIFAALPRYRATLFLDEHDPEIVDAFAEKVEAIGPYSYEEDWDPEEDAYSYDFFFTCEG